MNFFTKLKERLFTLDPERQSKKPEKIANKKLGQEKQDGKLIKGKKQISDKEQKLAQKVQKEFFKSQKQQGKIDKYVAGLDKSGTSFARRIQEIQARHHNIDEDFFDELEEILILSDISVPLVMEIVNEIKKEVKIEQVEDSKLINEIVADKIFTIYANKSLTDTTLNIKDKNKNVILIVGVNGVGKTTTIAKLAYKLKNEGQKILIAAGDTFRAGATEQLTIWAKRVGVDLVTSDKVGADPASVVFKALAKMKQEDYDVLIVDTAGRLQNKVNLMNELAKINKIIKREIPDAPHESLLVLDATTGQNGVLQAKQFKTVTPLTGIILTKMDGTSKGGIILTIKDQLDLAVKFLGLGEKVDDLQEFDLDAYIYGLTNQLMVS